MTDAQPQGDSQVDLLRREMAALAKEAHDQANALRRYQHLWNVVDLLTGVPAAALGPTEVVKHLYGCGLTRATTTSRPLRPPQFTLFALNDTDRLCWRFWVKDGVRTVMSFLPDQAGQPSESQPFYLPPAPPPPKRKTPIALWVGIAWLLVVLLGVGSWLLSGNQQAIAGHPVSASGTAPGGGKVITATDNRSQITVPNTWSPPLAEHKNDAAVIQVGDRVRGCYVMVISEAKADIVDFATFERLVLENTKQTLRDATVGARRTLTIGQLPAVQYVVTGTVDGLAVVYWFTLVDGKNDWHQVIGWTLQSKKDAEAKLIGDVINSFRELTSRP